MLQVPSWSSTISILVVKEMALLLLKDTSTFIAFFLDPRDTPSLNSTFKGTKLNSSAGWALKVTV